jgi:hypothetical protein
VCELAGALGETERAAVVSALLHHRQRLPSGIHEDFLKILARPMSPEALAPHVSEAEIPHLLALAGESRGRSVVRLFRGLKGKIESAARLKEALDAAYSLNGYDSLAARICLIGASDVASRLLFDEVLTSIAEVTRKNAHLAAQFLWLAAAVAPKERVKDLVALVSPVDSELDRSELLRRLGARLPPADADAFIAKVREVLADKFCLAAPLVAIAGRLSGPQRHALVGEAWGYIRECTYVRDRVESVLDLSAILDNAARNQLWKETLAFLDTKDREIV